MTLSKILLLCVLLSSSFVQAQETQYRFDHWTTNDGLPQNSVNSIVQTGDGYLWFTTLVKQ
jgi:ligand-binding sensor domain-containing protein